MYTDTFTQPYTHVYTAYVVVVNVFIEMSDVEISRDHDRFALLQLLHIRQEIFVPLVDAVVKPLQLDA